ncbi:MAG TPA: hypothetical protein VN229_07650 [Terriglobales bacterium]|nr:hypothetical protein [Terriglobales bacterium]
MTGDAKTVTTSSGWHFSLQQYAWAFGLYGKAGTRGHAANVSTSFIDSLQNSDTLLGLEAHAEAQYDRFGLFLDGTYIVLKSSYHNDVADGDVAQKIGFGEIGGFYRVIEDSPLWSPSAQFGGGTITIDALGGARYTSLDLDADASLNAQGQSFKRHFNGRRDWVDPFIGGRLLLRLTEKVDFIMRGDIGGFGVGSDFAWNTQALLGYHFTLGSAIGEAWAGYRAMGQDYESGSGNNAFKWNMVYRGPIIGFTARW